MIINTGNGYKVRVYDNGWVYLCELVDGEWRDCIFDTYKDAQDALDRYKEFWK